MIERIKIKGLFGIYDYDIELTNSAGLKIITGPNGYGKTTVLLIIYNLFNNNFWYFYNLPFETIEIIKDHKTKYVVTKKKNVDQENSDNSILNDSYEVEFNLFQDETEKPFSFRINKDYYDDLKNKYAEYYEKDYPVETIFDKEYDVDTDLFVVNSAADALLFNQTCECKYIESQRVFKTGVKRVFPFSSSVIRDNPYNISDISRQIEVYYRDNQVRFSQECQRIDSSFIERLTDNQIAPYTEEEFNGHLSDLKKLLDDYTKIGLVSSSDFKIKDEYKNYEDFKQALTLYVNDMLDKLDAFKKFYSQIDLFKGFVNDKVLSDKKMIVDEDGIKVVMNNGGFVPLHRLSSGEQNLIILAYDLVFLSRKDSIILVDEPENSLHLAWLGCLLDDYLKIAKINGCQFVVATHSAAFINNRWDLSTDLYEANSLKND